MLRLACVVLALGWVGCALAAETARRLACDASVVHIARGRESRPLGALRPDTAATRWRGEPIDYGLAVEVLLQRANRARDIPAGTRARS